LVINFQLEIGNWKLFFYMHKHVFGRKFSRDYGSRQALLRGLMRALILQGSIVTTKSKAKGVQPDIDGLVNLAKKNTVSDNRRAYAMLANDGQALEILTKSVAPVFASRVSGYTRIVPMVNRSGDNAEMAKLEWVEKVEIKEKPKSKKENAKLVKKEEKKTEKSKKGIAKLLPKAKKATKKTEEAKK
jgi:large subunit ribosomal protein L17